MSRASWDADTRVSTQTPSGVPRTLPTSNMSTPSTRKSRRSGTKITVQNAVA